MYAIRPFEPTDAEYQAVADLLRAANPHSGQPTTVAALKEHDADWEDGFLNQRYVIGEPSGNMVAVGTVREQYWQYEAGDLYFVLAVHPAFDDVGIFEAFYHYVVEALQDRTPTLKRLVVRVRENEAGRIRVVESHGFVATQRNVTSKLAVQAFDLSPSADREAALLANGVRIVTLAEAKVQDAAWKQKLYELRCALNRDLPGAGPKMEITLEQFQAMFLDEPALDPQAWWIAVDVNNLVGADPCGRPKTLENDHDSNENLGIGAFVGYSNLWINDQARKRLDTGMTGVIRGHRRRGIATMLKYKAIAYGQRHNAEQIVTGNEENNPMLDLNLQLGFEPIPGWIRYEKIFQAEQE